MEIANIVCPDEIAVHAVHAVLIQHEVDMNRIGRHGPFLGEPPDPSIYLVINYALSEQQTDQIRAALKRIPGVTTTP